jgi:hypothetical protein
MTRALTGGLICTLLGLTLAAFPARADDQKPSVQFNILSVEGLVIGKTITIDQAFGEKNGVSVAAPFSFVVPLSLEKAYEVFVEPAPNPGDSYIKINFATPDRQLIENIQFVGMTIPMGDPEQRLKVVANLLGDKGLAQMLAGKLNPARDGVRAVKIGDYDAVEVIGHYEEEGLGKMYARIVGILNPNAPDSVAAISNVVLSRVPLQTVDDFAHTRGGVLLSNFKYETAQ